MKDWLTCLKSYTDIVELHSFAAAARKRYSSASTLSKQINWLEEQFQCQLLQRTTRHVAVTEAGERVYQFGKQLFSDLNNLKEELQQSIEQVSGKLRVTMSVIVADDYVAPHIAEFLQCYPNLRFELDTSNSMVDMISEGYDVALRTTTQIEESYAAKQIGYVQRGIFAAPTYLKKYGAPQKIEDLKEHFCLHNPEYKNVDYWLFKDDKKIRVQGKLRSNSVEALKHAAIAGQGIAYMSSFRVQKAVQEGLLQGVLTEFWPQPTPIYFVYLKQQYLPRKVEVFIEFFAEKLKDVFVL